MLYEILCDKFIKNDGTPRGAITFYNGLNFVQGYDSGTNSIGKSTFLLVLDFVFGGEDYAKQKTIQRQVKAHDIKFCFVFDDKPYYFLRNNFTPKIVEVCDKNYVPTGDPLKLDEYRELLFNLYKIPLTDISFRDIVGRYFRIYGRDNADERSPLASTPKESTEKSIIALLKLYDHYTPVAEARDEYEKTKSHREAMSKALKFDIVKKITKAIYNENLKRLEALQTELETLASRGRDELLELDPNQAEKAAELKARQDILTKQKKRLWVQYYAIKSAADIRRPATAQDFEELTKYFPNSDLRKLGEIENFHSRLSSILEEEFSASMSSILALVNETSKEISIVEAAIQEINLPQRVSEKTLKSCASIAVEREKLKEENANYDTKRELDSGVKEKKAEYDRLFMQQVAVLQAVINVKMEKLNDEIYAGTAKAPVLTFAATNSYDFRTPDDDGTQLGVVPLIEARRRAEDAELDLVKISPTAVPPVCKIMDYGRYRYELQKREKEGQKNQKNTGLKEVWLSATIDEGDLKRLALQAAKFVKEGNRVKVSIRLKGRQQAYPDRAVEIIKHFIEIAGENIQVEKAPLQEGRNIYTILAPMPNKK